MTVQRCTFCGSECPNWIDNRCECCGAARSSSMPWSTAALAILAAGTLIALALLMAGCSKDQNPIAPTPPPPPAPTTATLHLVNTSSDSLYVYFDSELLPVLAPGASADYTEAIGTHAISWERIEFDYWVFNGVTFCLGPNNTTRPCNGTTVCSAAPLVIGANGITARPCSYSSTRTCQLNQTSVFLLLNLSTHDDDVLVDRIDRGVVHPATDPTNPQNSDTTALVVSPGTHHTDFLHYPPPRYNVCQDVTTTVAACEVAGIVCRF